VRERSGNGEHRVHMGSSTTMDGKEHRIVNEDPHRLALTAANIFRYEYIYFWIRAVPQAQRVHLSISWLGSRHVTSCLHASRAVARAHRNTTPTLHRTATAHPTAMVSGGRERVGGARRRAPARATRSRAQSRTPPWIPAPQTRAPTD
jgi:hypothetical protein